MTVEGWLGCAAYFLWLIALYDFSWSSEVEGLGLSGVYTTSGSIFLRHHVLRLMERWHECGSCWWSCSCHYSASALVGTVVVWLLFLFGYV